MIQYLSEKLSFTNSMYHVGVGALSKWNFCIFWSKKGTKLTREIQETYLEIQSNGSISHHRSKIWISCTGRYCTMYIDICIIWFANIKIMNGLATKFKPMFLPISLSLSLASSLSSHHFFHFFLCCSLATFLYQYLEATSLVAIWASWNWLCCVSDRGFPNCFLTWSTMNNNTI